MIVVYSFYLKPLLCVQRARQSRLTYKTGNEGCVRYPTEGNNSSHELTTTMHHLPTRLARDLVSETLRVGFKPW